MVRQVVGMLRGRGRKKAASRKVSQVADEKTDVAMTRSWSWMRIVSLSVDNGGVGEAFGWDGLDCYTDSAGSRVVRSGIVCARWSRLAERRCVLVGGEALSGGYL